MLTTLNQQLAKELKTCDKDSVKLIKKVMATGTSPACPTARQILDKICQLVCANDNATYAVEGVELFADEIIFQAQVKKSDPSTLDKESIKKIADEVNQTMDGVQGTLLAAVSQPSTASEMVKFFPYFKILFKLCQIGLTMKNKVNLERKLVQHQNSLKDLEAKVATEQRIIENLDFHRRISAEADRTRNYEVVELENKERELRAKIDAGKIYNNPDQFYMKYFGLKQW